MNGMGDYDFFTATQEEASQVASDLSRVGCCVRCILRFLGERNPSSYNVPTEELEKAILEKKEQNGNNMGLHACPACLGILQYHAEQSFLTKIKQKVEEDGYEFLAYQCSVMLPVSLIIRQRALLIHLCKKFNGIYSPEEDSIPTVKDVWKWSAGPSMSSLLDARFQNRSPFDVLLTFDYQDSDKECSFLLDVQPDVFRKRKQRKYGFETFTRANVAKAITDMSDSKFEDCSTCPPRLPLNEISCTITCSHDSVFIAGRYQKYSRTLSQTPWISDGKRIMEGSVEELICEPMTEMFKPKEMRLSSSGREDVDVRMLGTGRPFIIELVNPHRIKFNAEEMQQLREKINSSSKDVQVRDLQIVSREDTNKLKEGEIDKTKSYSAICWCERELTQNDCDMLSSMKDLTLQQKTPLRVLHRRTAMTRERVIHTMEIEPKENNRFKIKLVTQAGTYVKEFVHGDFGRTVPNLCTLLGAECDITDLDVESVDVDWPPFIDAIAEQLPPSQTIDNNQPSTEVSSKPQLMDVSPSTEETSSKKPDPEDCPRQPYEDASATCTFKSSAVDISLQVENDNGGETT